MVKELTGAVASEANALERTQADPQHSEKPTEGEGDVSREAFTLINPLPQWAAEAACLTSRSREPYLPVSSVLKRIGHLKISVCDFILPASLVTSFLCLSSV